MLSEDSNTCTRIKTKYQQESNHGEKYLSIMRAPRVFRQIH